MSLLSLDITHMKLREQTAYPMQSTFCANITGDTLASVRRLKEKKECLSDTSIHYQEVSFRETPL